jgi:hypothetical protein
LRNNQPLTIEEIIPAEGRINFSDHIFNNKYEVYMNEEKSRVLEVSEIISSDFDKAGISSVITSDAFDNLEELRRYLENKITELMDTNYEKLINILYRVDINEEKLNELFSSKNREFIPGRLAELIIERQIQKISIRNAYKRDNKRKLLGGE